MLDSVVLIITVALLDGPDPEICTVADSGVVVLIDIGERFVATIPLKSSEVEVPGAVSSPLLL